MTKQLCSTSSKVKDKPSTFYQGGIASLPIMLSYFPISFAFGLTAVQLGLSPLEAVLFSCVIYAGASQFVITALLTNGASLWVAGLTVMMMDVRHVLYGPSLKSRLYHPLHPIKSACWAFGLTDEVFVTATVKLIKEAHKWSENWMLGLALFAWLSWLAGTVAGVCLVENELWYCFPMYINGMTSVGEFGETYSY